MEYFRSIPQAWPSRHYLGYKTMVVMVGGVGTDLYGDILLVMKVVEGEGV